MRRIKVNQVLINFANQWSNNLFTSRNGNFEQPLDKLIALRQQYYPQAQNSPESIFLNWLISRYRYFLRLTPSQLQQWVQHVDLNYPTLFTEPAQAAIPAVPPRPGVPGQPGVPAQQERSTDFSDRIFDALRYDAVRDKEGIDIIEHIGVKTCVYCNAQLAVVVTKKGRNRLARMELDHFFSKSKYPFLSTSFFNLIPCCSNCNKSKSSRSVNFREHFYLYTEGEDFNPFKFSLDSASVANYWANRKLADLKIKFVGIGPNDRIRASNHNKTFAILPIYETQKDIAEELLYKQKAYGISKQNSLLKLNPLFPDRGILKRIIVGNYAKGIDTHKRPLAKFTQDIARQLKLI